MAFQNFSNLDSVKKLGLLAQKPFDLTASDSFANKRIHRYVTSACGFDLLYSTQRVEKGVLNELQNLADEAELVKQFMAMKNGELVNKIEGWESENRQVQHTACRDVFRDSSSKRLPVIQAKAQLERLRIFLDDVESGVIANQQGQTFKTMVQVGIGGSDLGPRALYLALKRYQLPGRNVRFIANVDPDDAAEVLGGLDLSRTLVNIVSKSGSTLETLTNELLVRSAFEKAGLEPKQHMVSVTGEGSPMDDPGNYLASFYMYDYIGGRYSVTSMVGAVSLGFALGYAAFEEILKGAHDMDVIAEVENIFKNLPLFTAMLGIWNHNFLGCDTLAVLPYSQALLRFPAHLQQCDMESNGKSISRNGEPVGWKTGPIIWGEPGTNGQHAFYQLLHQGTTLVPVEFIGFRQCQYDRDLLVSGSSSQDKLVANMLAQALAFAKGSDNENPNKRFAGNRPSSILLGEKLTPYSMGALLALYENRIAFQGFCWNINSFDQEGVQLGKILATRLLDELISDKQEMGGFLNDESFEKQILQAAGVLK